jgi:glutathione synthase/RimK-type ligase-like ATP-grasp enzyme
MRIFVSNNKIVGGWKRKATQGFMTVSKGEYTIYNEPEEEIAGLALKTAKAFKADFIATDFMLKDGKPYLQEISLHPGFKAYEEKATGGVPNNIAKAIIESFS